nr:hypothetical protein [Marinicella sp. W31]MDC2878331.1 hypothetical protein [Marinicella sp. W31]
MPAGFFPTSSDTHLGWIFWVTSDDKPDAVTGSVFNNSVFGTYFGGTEQFLVRTIYNGGVIDNVELRCRGASTWSNIFLLESALKSGALEQIGFEIHRHGDGTMTQKVFRNGVIIQERVTNDTAGWGSPTVGDTFTVGRHPTYPNYGMYGTFWQAMACQLDIEGARDFADTVSIDFELTQPRIAALIAA